MRAIRTGMTLLFSAIGALILLMLVLLGGALWLTLPSRDQTTRIPGLSAPIDIVLDQDGVPRIRAADDRDAAMALGYLHARDRMFQMELMRRAASGRLSELAGAVTLPFDRTMRVLGAHLRAEQDYPGLPDDTRALLEAYAAGVNARIAERGRFIAPEFLVFGPPEPWQPHQSLYWGKTMGLWLSANWRTEMSRLALAGKVPDRVIDLLWPPKTYRDGPTAMADPRHADAADAVLRAAPWFPAPFTQPPAASNEWAVDGRFTATGAPLLAGDPHLAFGFPGIWYLARIDLPDRAMAGATGPGVPGIVIGHNGRIAWTFTTNGADVQDVFIETPVGTDQYQTPDGPRPFLRRTETIRVRGQAEQTLLVRETRHGPVISDVQPAPGGAVLAVAMGHLQPGDTAAAGLMALNRGHTIEDGRLAAGLITSPVQTLLVADRERIALFVTGRVPIRKAGDGSRPVEGADGAHDWLGFCSPGAMPAFVAPASGRLLNANERVAPPDFTPFQGRDWLGDWRARRIRELLDAGGRFTPADFARMQVDATSVFARSILPVLLALPLPEDADRLRAMLRDWDGRMAADLPQPLIFNAWVREFHRMTLRQAGVPPDQGGPVADFVAHVLRAPPEGEAQRDSLLREALVTAGRTLADRFGPDPTAWRWGDAHQATFAHPVLRTIPVLGRLTTIALPSDGDDTTVNHGGLDGTMRNVHGAGFRGVFDLADLDRSLFIVTPGQSGNPLSRTARIFATRWRDGATVTLPRDVATPSATLRLTP